MKSALILKILIQKYYLKNIEFKFDVLLKDKNQADYETISKNSLYLRNNGGVFTCNLQKQEELFTVDDLIHSSLLNIAKNNFEIKNIPLINSPLASLPVPWEFIFKDIECYNFNPQFSKGLSKVNGDSNLLRYGENLAVILNKIFKDENNKRKFLNLVNDLLPFVNDIEINQLSDDQMFYSIFEKNQVQIPSFFISDGTTNIITLIVALYFDESRYVFIEEPERNIHPALLSKFVQMVEEASNQKQIIITTHSPEILKYMDLKNTYFISKGSDGCSKISRPFDNESLKPFIEEFGIDEVFIDNYMELNDE